MDLNTNGAKAIVALVALNAGLMVSHHHNLPKAGVQHPVVVAANVNSAEICKAQAEARKAALEARKAGLEARYQARVAARQVTRDVVHAAAMAPMSGAAKTRTSITDYVHCLVSSGTRSINSGS